jgi:hypothetical protein
LNPVDVASNNYPIHHKNFDTYTIGNVEVGYSEERVCRSRAEVR